MLAILLVCLCVAPSLGAVSRVNLTESGPEVSRIAYGTLHLGEAQNINQVLALIENALSLGITTFDLSDVYGNPYEANMKLFGQAINMKPGLRKEIQIIAKMDVWAGGYDTSKAHLETVMADYLRILQTEYIDIVLLHRQDYLMDAGEVAQVFQGWKNSGKALYVGLSNHDQDAFMNLESRGVDLVTNEIELSVWAPQTLCPPGSGSISGDSYFTNSGLVDYHYRNNVSVLAWGPLGGDPYGGPNRLFKKTGARQTQVLNALKAAKGQLGEDDEGVVALAWLLRHPAKIVPILGTMNLERMTNQTRAEAVAAKMTTSLWYQIARSIGVPLP